jgi:4-diphosphocytidyl-2-C-methyl-D-erythritol kinase
VPTKDVFAKLGLRPGETCGAAQELDPRQLDDRDALMTYMRQHPNDLERPAVALQPVIAQVLAALAEQQGCGLARMSGSGATCFGLFGSDREAAAAAQALASARAAWWVAATVLSG